MSALDRVRSERVELFLDIANVLRSRSDEAVEILARCEPLATARDELEKSIRALETYSVELPELVGRQPVGDVAVALPFNNPLYSLVIYAAGAALGGSRVTVRPSAHTRTVVEAVYGMASSSFQEAGIFLTDVAGREFLDSVYKDDRIQSLIFTGAHENMLDVAGRVPLSKRFVYCGSGVNPFVVGPLGDTEDSQTISSVASLASRSRLYNSGQDCLCAERFYVHESVFEPFIDALVDVVSAVQFGGFGAEGNLVTPLIDPIAARARSIVGRLESTSRGVLRSPIVDDMIGPQIFIVDSDSMEMRMEKFAPIFTVGSFSSQSELSRALSSEYLLGITICGDVSAPEVLQYPHLSTQQSVIEDEAEDAHRPFGGRAKSGFSRRGPDYRDGPLVFSLETTEPIK